jgi:hypothetical protein
LPIAYGESNNRGRKMKIVTAIIKNNVELEHLPPKEIFFQIYTVNES